MGVIFNNGQQILIFNLRDKLLIKMRKTYIFIFFLWALCSATKKLIFIQELFRHGARYPIYPTEDDGSDYARRWNSQGELTTQGKNMHYLLGKKIYQRYWNQLFQGTEFASRYNQSKFYFKSTDVNRTIESCQSHLMGIFEQLEPLKITQDQANFSAPFWPDTKASEGLVFPNGPAFHPLPIHVEKVGTNVMNSGDFLRSYSPENCPRQKQWSDQNQNSAFAKKIYTNESIVKTLDAFSKILNKTVTFQKVGEYYDNFQTTQYLSLPFQPIFIDPQHERNLRYMYVLDLYINLFLTTQQKRVTSSGFFDATLKNIKRAQERRDVQWVIYSAHDTTVANMLAAMNLTNAACIYDAYINGDDYNRDTCIPDYPIYTASIIFEVYYDNETDLTTFKIVYGGVPRKIPFCNWEEECRVDVFESWFEKSIKTDDFDVQCGIYSSDQEFLVGVSVIELAIILVLILVIFKTYLSRAKLQESKISQQQKLKESLITEDIQ